MGRWEPGSKDRLGEAAMELFTEQGYERTTVAEIAARAGVTERTFFRHYVDKRDVLFAGSEVFGEVVVAGVASSPPDTPPVDAAVAGVRAGMRMVSEFRGRELAARRGAVIQASAELRERELIKLAGVAEGIAEALRERGVEPDAATLAAELGLAVLHAAFGRWMGGTEEDPDVVIDATLADLRSLAA